MLSVWPDGADLVVLAVQEAHRQADQEADQVISKVHLQVGQGAAPTVSKAHHPAAREADRMISKAGHRPADREADQAVRVRAAREDRDLADPEDRAAQADR
jgi:hypothetical protein